MTTAEKITELQQAIRQRMDALAGADPTCNRLMGRIDVLQEQANAEAGENNEVPFPGAVEAPAPEE